MNIKKLFSFSLAVLFAAGLYGQEGEKIPETTFKFGGFAKTDYIVTQYNNGTPASNALNDFHIPGFIPVGDIDVTRNSNFHVKESRFNLDVSSLVGGKKVRAFVEMDFMLSGQGNERVSNSYAPRLRHFYLEYDKLLVGQTWSTFMVVIIPDELDFIGAAEGVVFVRQPMARITLGGLQFALESQLTTITPNGGGIRMTAKTGLVPDVVARYNLKLGAGTISFAAIGRHLHYKSNNDSSHSMIGTGVTVGGKMKIGKRDDIRFSGTGGIGLGRYVGLNFVNSTVIDNSDNLKPIPTFNGYVAYLHHWSSKLRSSASGSYFYAINDTDLVGTANNRAASISGNIMYQPVSKLLFGAEFMWGYREQVGGANGDFLRMQFSAKYAFSFKTSTGK